MLSEATRARLREELHALETTLIPAAHAAIEDARTQGDTSQNPDFFLAAEEEGKLYTRRSIILAALAETIDTVFDGTVQAGVVVVLDFGTGPEEFLVGSVEELRSGFDVITPGSPLGIALLGHHAGDVVRSGPVEVTVVDVHPG
jgi:transcription elongation factor GreA